MKSLEKLIRKWAKQYPDNLSKTPKWIYGDLASFLSDNGCVVAKKIWGVNEEVEYSDFLGKRVAIIEEEE